MLWVPAAFAGVREKLARAEPAGTVTDVMADPPGVAENWSPMLSEFRLTTTCWAAGAPSRAVNADVKRLLALIWPAAAGAGAVQINLVISTLLATALLAHGSATYIYMADRLNQLPLGLIGIGLGTVLLPFAIVCAVVIW